MNTSKKNTINILFVVLMSIVCFCVGCTNVGTSGEGGSLLPINFGFSVDAALAKGPNKIVTGFGRSARDIAQTQSQDGFNESWKEVGVAKHENSNERSGKNPKLASGDRSCYRN